MTNTYCSTIDITDCDDMIEAKSFTLGGVQLLAQEAGMVLSERQVFDRTSFGTFERDGRTILQAILVVGD